jgi:hypothetical protein
MDEHEEPISLEQVLKELQAKGVPVTGEEIAEAELQARVGDGREGDSVRAVPQADGPDPDARRNGAT